MQPYSSGSVSVLLSTRNAGRFFKALGSRRATLSWDAIARTVTISSPPTKNAPEEINITKPASQIDRAFFHNGDYTLWIDGKIYSMEISHYKNQGGLANDLINSEDTLLSSFKEANSSVTDLVALLKEAMPQKNVYAGYVSSQSRLKLTIFLFFAFLVICFVVGLSAGAHK